MLELNPCRSFLIFLFGFDLAGQGFATYRTVVMRDYHLRLCTVSFKTIRALLPRRYPDVPVFVLGILPDLDRATERYQPQSPNTTTVWAQATLLWPAYSVFTPLVAAANNLCTESTNPLHLNSLNSIQLRGSERHPVLFLFIGVHHFFQCIRWIGDWVPSFALSRLLITLAEALAFRVPDMLSKVDGRKI